MVNPTRMTASSAEEEEEERGSRYICVTRSDSAFCNMLSSCLHALSYVVSPTSDTVARCTDVRVREMNQNHKSEERSMRGGGEADERAGEEAQTKNRTTHVWKAGAGWQREVR